MIKVFFVDPDKNNNIEIKNAIKFPEMGHGNDYITKIGEEIREGDCIVTSSELIFDVLRRRIVAGELNCDDIEFIVVDEKGDSEKINVNKFGALSDYPSIFGHSERESMKILRFASEKRRAKL